MRLLRLDIRRMPGFADRGFTLPELGEGLNLIVGPNASGKTTACRSIRGLLWPETLAGDSPVSLVGAWRDENTELLLDLEGNRRTCQRDGAPAEIPFLPGSHLANCFTVTVDDLFDGSDSDLAERIRQEMAGGYNLAAVRELECMAVPARLVRKKSDALDEARAAVRAIQAAQETLQRDEGGLTEVEEQAREASAARARLQRLDDVRQFLQVRARIVEVESALGAFPPDMDRLRGNEGDQLRNLDDNLERQNETLAEARARVEEAETSITAADLPAGGVAEVRLAEQGSLLRELRETEGKLARAEEDLVEAEAEARRTLSDLKHVGDEAKLGSIDLSTLDEVEAFHRTAEDLAQRRQATEAQIEALSGSESTESIEQIVQGMGVLREWFESGGTTDVDRLSTALTWLMVIVLGVAGVVLAAIINLWWGGLVLLAVVAAIAKARFEVQEATARRMCQARYARLSVPTPETWDVEGVRKCLRKLEELQAKTRLADEYRVQREPLIRALASFDEQERLLDGRRQDLIQCLGVAPDTSVLALVVMAACLRSYQETAVRREACRAAVEQLRVRRDAQFETVDAFLSQYGLGAAQSSTVAQTRGDALTRRATQYREASTAFDAASRAVKTAEEVVARLMQRKRQLFEDSDLDDEARVELEERLSRLEDWRARAAARQELRNQAARLNEKLGDAPDLLEMKQEQLDSESSRLMALADNYEAIVNQVHDVRTRVDRTRSATRLTEALAAEQDARDDLTEAKEREALAATGRFLVDEIEAHYEAESQPDVLRQAVTWFGRFVRGTYELKVDRGVDGGAVFYARDTASGQGLSLSQLSRGTRMQLLLAVRLAFAAAAERGTRLPFVLDEVLSSTDPVRFQAIAESLLALVREGRQVFYCTCQPGDARAWREVARREGVEDAVYIDLAKVRGLESAASSLLDASTIQVEPVPEPGDMDLPTYAKILGVPALEPSTGAGGAHLAHLVEDTTQLRTLLEAGVATYGQLHSLASLGNVDALIDAGSLARVRARAQVLDAFADAWHVGRGESLSREVLARSGVSDVFIDRIADLASDLDWDAKLLVEALERRDDDRVSGFRKAAVGKLSENLTETGYLDLAESLDEEALLVRVLAAANESIKAGVIDVAEVRRFFLHFWKLSCRTDAVAETDSALDG